MNHLRESFVRLGLARAAADPPPRLPHYRGLVVAAVVLGVCVAALVLSLFGSTFDTAEGLRLVLVGVTTAVVAYVVGRRREELP